MVDYTTLLHELPDFLRNQVVSSVGSTHNLSLVQILSRYRGQADRLAAEKRSQYRGYRDISDFFDVGPLDKAQMDFLKGVVDGRPTNHSSLFEGLRDRYVGESIPYLIRFSEALVGLQAQAEQAEEAARQRAQRQAEEAARQEAARQQVQRQAEEAARQEAARQQAQRQAEEAARQEAARQEVQRQAEKGAFLLTVPSLRQVVVERLLQQAKAERAAIEQTGIILGEKGKEILWLPGLPAASELEKALAQFNEDVDKGIGGFIAAMDFDAGVTASEAFNAMLYALNLSSAEIPAFSR